MPGKNVFADGSNVYTKSGTTEFQVMSSTGALYHQGVVLPDSVVVTPYVETLTLSSGGLTPSSMTSYGISWVQIAAGDPSTSVRLATMGAPRTGVTKTIVFATTVAYINTLDIDVGAGVGVGHITGSTTARYIAFSTLATEYQTVNLVGLSTALWGVMSVDSTVGGFGSAEGIRSLTAARTS